jgi:acetyltransferase-like isoleucine patch superfamily enzyme
MKKNVLIILIILSVQFSSLSQVLISPSENDEQPNSSAILELKNDNNFLGGVLIPKIILKSKTDTSFLSVSPAEGLLVYNEYNPSLNPEFKTEGYMYWTGTEWKRFIDISADYKSLDTPSATRRFNAYIGPYAEQDIVNGVRAGDFCFKIDWTNPNIPPTTNVGPNMDVYIKYIGEKDADTIMSYAFTLYSADSYDTYGSRAATVLVPTGTNDISVFNTNIIEKDKGWYHWGNPGIEVGDNVAIWEKRQYTFTVYNKDVKEFYRCEFILSGMHPTNNAKVCIYVERIISNL